jgi:hypothetical protein
MINIYRKPYWVGGPLPLKILINGETCYLPENGEETAVNPSPGTLNFIATPWRKSKSNTLTITYDGHSDIYLIVRYAYHSPYRLLQIVDEIKGRYLNISQVTREEFYRIRSEPDESTSVLQLNSFTRMLPITDAVFGAVYLLAGLYLYNSHGPKNGDSVLVFVGLSTLIHVLFFRGKKALLVKYLRGRWIAMAGLSFILMFDFYWNPYTILLLIAAILYYLFLIVYSRKLIEQPAVK